MVDLQGQHHKIKDQLNQAIATVIESSLFIKGPEVNTFEQALGDYLNNVTVTACGNGTDALQLALMALGLEPEDEVLAPSFTYVACAEVIALLQLKPVWVDVDAETFNIDTEKLKEAISPRTKAIIVVHLFGQSADMGKILEIAEQNQLFVIEDNAQSLGAEYLSRNKYQKAGTLGHIGCTSFFPSKILGCMGDGGAVFTSDPRLSERIGMIANHGQKVKYYHDLIGINSRLDTLQAAVLNIKLQYIDDYIKARQQAANLYDHHLSSVNWLTTPNRAPYSTHVFHQYTLKLEAEIDREKLREHLKNKGVPSMIYYPLPLHQQKAYKTFGNGADMPVSEALCKRVISLPMHTELKEMEIQYIADSIKSFIN